MDVVDIAQQYFTYQSRLDSFRVVHKKRVPNASGKGGTKTQTLKWTHKQISTAELAEAGFFYHPLPNDPDQVACFLCHRCVAGWEAGDSPLREHLTHAPMCGWAIVAAIESKLGGYVDADSMSLVMLEARKMTFAGRWPHESKKLWKCKTKQLAAAGWKYTPTPESDDMATCAYCDLALEGWEPGDKPLEEHWKRSPDCPFFQLSAKSRGAKKSTRAGRVGVRVSKVSRLSSQSDATLVSEGSDLAPESEDSVLPTVPNATQASNKGGKSRNGSTRGRKGARGEAAAVLPDASRDFSPPRPPAAKLVRGRKRASQAMDEEMEETASEAPPPKKRNNKTRGSAATVKDRVGDVPNAAPAVDKPKRGRKGAAKPNAAKTERGTSAVSQTSMESKASKAFLRGPGAFPSDEEEEPTSQPEDVEGRDHRMTDDEIGVLEASAYYMFDTAPPQFDETALDEELRELREGMEREQRRSASRIKEEQDRVDIHEEQEAPLDMLTEEEAEAEEEAEVEAEAEAEEEEELEEDEEEADESGRRSSAARSKSEGRSTASARGSAAEPPERGLREQPPDQMSFHDGAARISETSSEASTTGRRKRGSSKKEHITPAEPVTEETPVESVESDDLTPENISQPSSRPRTPSPPPREYAVPELGFESESEHEHEHMIELGSGTGSRAEPHPGPVDESQSPSPGLPRSPQRQVPAASSSASPSSVLRHAPSTPGTSQMSPAPSARQPVPSPPRSPQSSDAENHAPSARTPATARRVALAPPTLATPIRGSPSRRGAIPAGRIRTEGTPWKEVDLETVFAAFEDMGREEAGGDLWDGQELSGEEMEMTVEQWIQHNAAQAEARMRHECETMVSRFESEGGRAMRVLEGLVVDG